MPAIQKATPPVSEKATPTSIRKNYYNLQTANRREFTKYVDANVGWFSQEIKKYDRFVGILIGAVAFLEGKNKYTRS